jgi:GT2 family glycosyltransferase
VRRSAFESTGGFDECYGMYCEELDLARRLQARGWTRLVAPASRVTHVGGAATRQMPDAMRAALWRSRGRYHRIWDSRARQRTVSRSIRLACALRSATETTDRAERWRSIPAAFEAGLRCPV